VIARDVMSYNTIEEEATEEEEAREDPLRVLLRLYNLEVIEEGHRRRRRLNTKVLFIGRQPLKHTEE
jgi:hypothetical protein